MLIQGCAVGFFVGCWAQRLDSVDTDTFVIHRYLFLPALFLFGRQAGCVAVASLL